MGHRHRPNPSHTLCTYNKYQQEAESPNSHVNSRLDEMDKAHNLCIHTDAIPPI
jgi:hypothetical protein